MGKITRQGRARKLSVSIREDLAEYVAERAAREERALSELVAEGIEELRRRERDDRAALAYAEDREETRAWAEDALTAFADHPNDR